MGDVVTESGGLGPAWAPISESAAWKDLKMHVKTIEDVHLRQLLNNEKHCAKLIKEYDGVVVDFSRKHITDETLDKLFSLAKINRTEDRPVLHAVLRAPREKKITTDGKDVVPEVWEVLDKIKNFSDEVRSGKWLGATGKPLTDVVAIGIGGSFLEPLFVQTTFQTEPHCALKAKGQKLRFLANVDPIDVSRALFELHQETTLGRGMGVTVRALMIESSGCKMQRNGLALGLMIFTVWFLSLRSTDSNCMPIG